MTINKIIAFFVRVLIIIAFAAFISSCSTGNKYCDPSNIKSGRSSQHHDGKKFKASIKIIHAKQYGNMCEVRYENKKEMFNVVYDNCDCKKIPVGCWVSVDSI
jgi:hypothetical protein